MKKNPAEQVELKPNERCKEALVQILTGAQAESMPESIFILDGDITEVTESENKYDFFNPSRFRTNTFYDKDLHGAITGAQARVVAGAELNKFFPELILVATDTRYHPDEPTHAVVQRSELMQLGVKAEKILLEEHSK